MALYEDLAARLDFRDSQEWAAADKVERALIAASAISTAVLATYRTLRGTPVEQAELSSAIEKLYAEYIAPLDIPKLGPVAEMIVDQQVAKVIGALVPKLDELLDKKGL